MWGDVVVDPKNQCSLGGGGLLDLVLSFAGGRVSLTGKLRGGFVLVGVGAVRGLEGAFARTTSLRGVDALGRSGLTTTAALWRSGFAATVGLG